VLARQVKRRLSSHPAAYHNARRAHALARWAARRPHEPDFEFYGSVAAPPAGSVFLDVGAHIGTSALSFRVYDKRTRIVSIEPNATLERDLKLVARLIRGFEYRLVGAGRERGESTLYTPVYRGTPLTGEASLTRPEPEDVWWLRQNVADLKPGDFWVVEQRVQVIPLDELELAPAHVKIDVEGMELDALCGMQRTLERHAPTILLERSERFDEVREWLHDVVGYEPRTWRRDQRRLIPYEPARPAQNVFLIPGSSRTRAKRSLAGGASARFTALV
jgi:FkbM family methyltransferase